MVNLNASIGRRISAASELGGTSKIVISSADFVSHHRMSGSGCFSIRVKPLPSLNCLGLPSSSAKYSTVMSPVATPSAGLLMSHPGIWISGMVAMIPNVMGGVLELANCPDAPNGIETLKLGNKLERSTVIMPVSSK